MKRKTIVLIIALLSLISILKSQTFPEQHLITEQAFPYACKVADLDGDGFKDFIGYSMEEEKLMWFKNNGNHQFSARYLPMTDLSGYCLHIFDMDNDADMDIMIQPSWGSELFWYENDGTENFTQHTCVSGISFINSSQIIDVDEDGDADVVASRQNSDEVLWLENNGSNFFTYHSVYTSADYITSVFAVDVDSDNDIDFISASFMDDKIAWYENDGNENFTTQIISTTINGAQYVYGSDIDSDNDMDILFGSTATDRLGWFINDGSENFSQQIVSSTIINPDGGFIYDMDSDGDMDIFSTSNGDDKIYYYENDGNENFTSFLIPTKGDGPEMIFPADVDNDGNTDLVSTTLYDNKIQWHQNSGMLNFTEKVITSWAVEARKLATADIDGDNDLDVISASFADNRITWYENLNDKHFIPHTISDTTSGAYDIFAVDMDFDNKTDIVAAAKSSGTISWYKNNGNQNFTGHIVKTGQSNLETIFVIDLDLDNDMDIIAGSNSGGLYWYENDGNLNFTQNAVNSAWKGFRDVEAADMDNDGDIDIVANYMPYYSYDDSYLYVYKNDGNQNFSNLIIVDDYYLEMNQLHLIDFDKDSDIDILSTMGTTALVWYEKTGSSTYPYSMHTISSGIMDYPWTINAADIDNDNDIDLVVPSSDANAVHWVENQNNTTYIVHNVSSQVMYSFSALAGDVDGDGDLDIITASQDDNKVSWHENSMIVCDLFINLNINGNTDFCEGDSIEIEAYTVNTTANYQWFLNGDTIPGATDSVITVYYSGIYHAIVTDTACSKITPYVTINVMKEITELYPSVCFGDSVLVGTSYYSQTGIFHDTLSTTMGCDSIIITNLTVNSNFFYNDTMQICDGDSAFWQGNYYFSSGLYFDSLNTVFGCDSVLALNLFINSNPTVYINGNTEDCTGTLLDEGLGIPGDQYIWSTGDTTQTIFVTASDIYSLTVTNGNGCTGSDTADVTIFGLPDIYLGPDTILCDVDNITLDAGSGFDSYLWSDGSTLQYLTVDSSGIGLNSEELFVLINDSNLCQNSDTIIISFVLCTEIAENKILDINIYPNPVDNEINIEFYNEKNKSVYISIISANGKEVFNKEYCNIENNIKISGLKAKRGVYFIKLITENEVVIEKLIIN